jgi:flagellar biosynthesis chaperone FliJ
MIKSINFGFTRSSCKYPGLYFATVPPFLFQDKLHYIVKIGLSHVGIDKRLKSYVGHNPLIINNNLVYPIMDKSTREKQEELAHTLLGEISIGVIKGTFEWYEVSKNIYDALIKNPWQIFDEKAYSLLQKMYNQQEQELPLAQAETLHSIIDKLKTRIKELETYQEKYTSEIKRAEQSKMFYRNLYQMQINSSTQYQEMLNHYSELLLKDREYIDKLEKRLFKKKKRF